VLKTKLFNFQQEDVEQIERWKGRGLIGSEQGTGKTVVSLALIDRNPKWLPAVIVCPAHLKWNWQNEFRTHIDMEADILSGLKPDMDKLEGRKAVIINYDILYAWLPHLKYWKPKMVIADECQAVCAPSSRRTKALASLVEDVPHFIPMSGTPITNRTIEFWPVLNMLDQDAWPNRYTFGHRYCKPKRNPFSGGWDFKGCSKPEELNRILRQKYMVRRLKRDVLKDLPDKMFNTVKLKLTNKQMKEYRGAKESLRDWLRVNYSGGKKDAARSEAFQRVNVLRQLTADLKLPHVIEWIETFLESGEKLIAFGWHRRIVQAVHIKFKQSVLVNGDTPGRERQEAADRFNTDKDCNLYVGNIQAAGSGWSAKACSNVGLMELPWKPADVGQTLDRAHGIGRGQAGITTSGWFLLADDTQDVKMLDLLAEKQKNLDRVLDGAEAGEGTVFDDIVKWLIK
jgi:SWI/SNF-related matrix-associated actin-dependent regulator 1 of chromatin subfamily A